MKFDYKQLLIVILMFFLVLVTFSYNLNYDVKQYCDNSNTEDCFYNLAIETKNYSYCEYELNGKDLCYQKLSFKFKDMMLCSNLNNSELCYIKNAVFHEDIEFCTNTDDFDYCVFQTAINNLDINYCEEADNIGYCYYSYALAVNNKTLCYSSLEFEEVCFEKLK